MVRRSSNTKTHKIFTPTPTTESQYTLTVHFVAAPRVHFAECLKVECKTYLSHWCRLDVGFGLYFFLVIVWGFFTLCDTTGTNDFPTSYACVRHGEHRLHLGQWRKGDILNLWWFRNTTIARDYSVTGRIFLAVGQKSTQQTIIHLTQS